MKVKALISFAGYDGAGKSYTIEQGQEFELPAGVDWLKAGLVAEASPQEKPETEAKSKKRKSE